jgi:3-oxoacyl-[acyl-carrier protein] reductase
MDLGLTDKVAFVAGASRGLGYAAARELALAGARVAICARDEVRVTAAAGRLTEESGREVHPFCLDVTAEGQLEAAIDETAARWGGLHILVTNAGGPPPGRFNAIDDQVWRQAWDLNFLSTVRMIRAALPHMRTAGWGRIIAITSITVKQPVEQLLLSNAIRPGIIGLMRDLAAELAPLGITINSVGPGYTRTERVEELLQARAAEAGSTDAAEQAMVAAIPMGRLGEVEEFAAAVAFLASARASYITGQSLLVDGGWYRGMA